MVMCGGALCDRLRVEVEAAKKQSEEQMTRMFQLGKERELKSPLALPSLPLLFLPSFVLSSV
jgi:hypothetical protein